MFGMKIWTTPLRAARYYYFKSRISTPMASAVQLTRRITQTVLLGMREFPELS